jgi:hypothetical protein
LSVHGTWTCVLLLALSMAWVGSVEATEPGGSAPFPVGSVQHVSHAAPSGGSNTTSEPAQGAAGVFEATPPLASGGALVITPTFDSSITGDANAAAIEAMITNAINVFEAQFNDPITVTILFRYATTQPNGSPLPSGALAISNKVIYIVPWSTYITALVADATTGNDATANGSLPGSPLDTNVDPASADGRAVGLNTPPAMFADGSLGVGGPYDGIVTINSSAPFAFTRPPTGGQFDAQTATEHEMDEVMGFGSYLNLDPGGTDLEPQDLFSWSAAGVRNLLSTGTRYFSIDGGTTDLVGFNQTPPGDFGDWLSGTCPQATPFVQNAFGCPGQAADVTGTSPEGINLDVIGYDLLTATTTSTTTSTTTTSTTTSTTSSTTTTTTLLAPLCASVPAVGCRLATPGAASVQLKANATPARDQFKWKWARGAATAVTDFKDPVGGSATYRVCVYDGSARSQPLMEMDVPPGGTCGTKPCWKASGTTGFSFANKLGTTTGLTSVKLKAGSAGKAQVQAAGKGASLPMPTLGLTLPVTVQFLAKDALSTECWQTAFTTEKKNDVTQFSAKGP